MKKKTLIFRTKTAFMIIVLLILSGGHLFAQTSTLAGNFVSGVVKDASSNEALIGVSVSIKGTTTGVMTDFDGSYKIAAPVGAVLVYSYVGYITQEVKVTGTSHNIRLVEQAFEIDEIVVVGVVMKKSDLTGAVGNISGEVLSEKPVTTVNEALQGRVAGVNISNPTRPGDDASIKIRGINTINSSTDPIYVVDGLVMDNFASGFGSINVNDVASVEVLKDASATALYGSRGSNGVVVITTKKGQKGEGKVSYNTWVGIQTFAKTPKRMKTKDLFELRRDAALNGYAAVYPNATQAEKDAYYENTIMGSNKVFADYEFDAYKSNDSYDWLDEVTRTGIQQNHSLSFSGATDKSNYYVSFGYADQKGLVKETGEVKYTGRVNLDKQIKKWLKIGTNTSFLRVKADLMEDGVMDKARNANPMLAIDRDVLTINYQGVHDQNSFNPLRSLSKEKQRTRSRLMSTNYLNINPIKGLNIRTSLAIDYVEQKQFEYTPKDIQESIRYSLDGEAKHNRDSRTMWQWDNTISYDTTIGKHRINAMFGTSLTRFDRDYTYANGKGFLTDDLGYHNIGNSYKKKERDMGSDFITESLAAYIARFNYNYDSRYYLTGTVRYDGSSKFGNGHQWGTFPSFSGAWDVTNESFMADQTILDQVKVRVGFGVVGNQNIDNFGYLSLYNVSITENKDGSYTASPQSNGRRGTPNIKWEKQQQYNVGFDTRFLKNRFGVSVDMFFIKNKDLLMTRPLALTTGYGNTIENIGAIENKGVEVTLDANIINTKDFKWNMSANISADKNKVTKLFGNAREILKIDGDRNISREGNLFIGQSRNTIYTFKSGGIAQASDMDRLNKYDFMGRKVNPGDLYILDTNEDNLIDDSDRVVIGSMDPKFYGGFSSDFSWKGISLNAVFTYSCGAKKMSPYYESLIGGNGTGVASIDLKDRWSETNTNASLPRPILLTEGKDYQRFGPGDSDYAVQNASYLRLSTLTLAYDLSSSLVNKMKLGSVRVYATGSNLFCATKYKGFDPETGDWYPPSRMYVFGLNLSF